MLDRIVSMEADEVRQIEQQLKGLSPTLLRANLQEAEAYRPFVEKHDVESIVEALEHGQPVPTISGGGHAVAQPLHHPTQDNQHL